MHGATPGLILAGTSVLASGGSDHLPLHPDYEPSRDSVRTRLLLQGRPVGAQFFGTMPFGWGFASSSALAYLHLAHSTAQSDLRSLIDRLDRETHGFEPSGLDSGFQFRGRHGLFHARSWQEVPPLGKLSRIHCVLPTKERALSLAEVQRRILRQPRLRILASEMNRHAMGEGLISQSALFDYASELLECDIYSHEAAAFVGTALASGIAAKGVGGLYDKAILLFDFGGGHAIDQLRRTVAASDTLLWFGTIYQRGNRAKDFI